MCDYSLCGIPNRLAIEGEELVVYKFSTGSMGLASIPDIKAVKSVEDAASHQTLWTRVLNFLRGPAQPRIPAVCVPPGAQLMVKNIPPALQFAWDIQPEEYVEFVQLTATPNMYRDAIRFKTGRQVRLQNLPENLPVQVLSLDGAGVLERYEENFQADHFAEQHLASLRRR
jgi:hypothetical protein